MNLSKFQIDDFERDMWTQVSEPITPLGWTLQNILRADGVLQRDLAKKLGIAPSNLSATLRGRIERPLSATFINNISSALNLTPERNLVLEHAAQLSLTTFKLEMSPPWKFALAARFHRELPLMETDLAVAIDALLANPSSKKTSKLNVVGSGTYEEERPEKT